jgi:hypothetical protein
MNPHLTDTYRKSADKALGWLLQQLKPDGSYGSAIDDLACYYKSPYLFYISGRIAEARRILIHIQQAYMQANGDFMTSAGIKSANGALAEYRAYTNGWIASAAQKMGSFDVAYPAYRYLSSFCHKKNGGFTTQKPYGESENIVDAFTTAHLGLTSLYFGGLEKAEKAGHLLQKFFSIQPHLGSGFYLRMDDAGRLITEYAKAAALFHKVSASESEQAYFMIGYPIAFLGKLYLATANTEYLEAALRYLDFAMGCHSSIRAFHYSHKVAWGAAIIAGITKEGKYTAFAEKIVDHLLGIQDADGAWLMDEPAHTSFDQTAEIAIWLREISSEFI